jgi:hypothetical protein
MTSQAYGQVASPIRIGKLQGFEAKKAVPLQLLVSNAIPDGKPLTLYLELP